MNQLGRASMPRARAGAGLATSLRRPSRNSSEMPTILRRRRGLGNHPIGKHMAGNAHIPAARMTGYCRVAPRARRGRRVVERPGCQA